MTVPTSHNGWPVITSGLWPLPAVTGSVKAGPVWVVFHWLAREYARKVEKIIRAESWGYAYRQVRSGTAWSNHASGTAVDFNAPAHPFQRSGTMTAAQEVACRAIEQASGGVLNWGDNIPDEMHWEVAKGVTAAQVERFATKLLQGALNLPITGDRDAHTIATLKAFQQAHGLAVDGIDGPKTWDALLSVPPPAPAPAPDLVTPKPAPTRFRGGWWNVLGDRFVKAGQTPWAERRAGVAAIISETIRPSVLGLAECYSGEDEYLLANLGGAWVKKSTTLGLHLLTNGTKWEALRQWTTVFADRVHGFTVVEAQHRASGQVYNLVAAHLTPPSRASEGQRKVEFGVLAQFVHGWKDPTILMGDFNTEAIPTWAAAAGFAAGKLTEGTCGSKKYDWIIARGVPLRRVQVIDANGTSDHDAVSFSAALPTSTL